MEYRLISVWVTLANRDYTMIRLTIECGEGTYERHLL